MKTQITFITILMLFSTFIYAQIVPNGGFEAWTDGEPDEWTTNNVGPLTTISQSIISHSGSYAVRGQTDSEETIVPIIEAGYDNLGFPVSEKYEQLSFWYQYVEEGSDMLFVTAKIVDEDYSILGHANLEIEDATEEYTLGILPIVYDAPGTPAFALISFSLYDATGGDPPDSETYFLIDDINLSGSVGIDEQLQTEISIYPNPATDMLNVKAEIEVEQISILNTQGQEVYQEQLNRNAAQIDLSNFLPGLYFARIEADGKTYSKKIIIR